MSVSRCGRLARVSLGALRTPVAISARPLVARAAVRGVSSASRDAQQKVGHADNSDCIATVNSMGPTDVLFSFWPRP